MHTYPLRRVLVIDDDPEVLDVLSSLLIAKGAKVLTASNGKDALDLIEREPPMAILSDIQMPDMDGMQLHSELKRRDLDIPLIFVTGDGTRERLSSALRLGAFDFFEKPFNIEKIWDVLVRAIEVGVHKDRVRQEVLTSAPGRRSHRLIELLQLSNHLSRKSD